MKALEEILKNAHAQNGAAWNQLATKVHNDILLCLKLINMFKTNDKIAQLSMKFPPLPLSSAELWTLWSSAAIFKDKPIYNEWVRMIKFILAA